MNLKNCRTIDMDIDWLMQQFAGKWPEGMFLKGKSKYKICQWKKGAIMPATQEQWGGDRNGLVKQSLIGEHMVRITLEPNIPGGVFRVTIGMFWKYGNGSSNKRYREWTSRRVFALGPLAWQYGVRLVKGATHKARND